MIGMLSEAIKELEAAHDAASAEQILEAARLADRAVRILRCIADLRQIDAEERDRLDAARRAVWNGEQCVDCCRYGRTLGGLCETCRHDRGPGEEA